MHVYALVYSDSETEEVEEIWADFEKCQAECDRQNEGRIIETFHVVEYEVKEG